MFDRTPRVSSTRNAGIHAARLAAAAPRRGAPKGRGAYTLIELLIVIGLLGLAGGILVPHLVGRDTLTAQAAVRQLIADLSFAQSDALANQEYRRVHFYSDGRGYCLVRTTSAGIGAAFDPDTADYVLDPLKGGSYIVDFVADTRWEGVSIAAVSVDGGGRDLYYDTLGGTIRSGDLPGTGGTIDVAFAAKTFRLGVSPFTGKLSVSEL